MDFQKRAFTPSQLDMIELTLIDNSVSSTGFAENPYVSNSTEDKVFLLSYAEVTSSALGFNENSDRKRKASDYAIQNGVSTEVNYSFWWLRSPYNLYSSSVRSINNEGKVEFFNVYSSTRGILPAMRISLS